MVLGPEEELDLFLRDQADFHWAVMFPYMKTMHKEMGLDAPSDICWDGVQSDLLGELNSYWVIQPERRLAGVPERSGFCPLQEC